MNHNAEYCSAFNFDASETVAYNNPLFPAYVRYRFLSSYPDYSSVSHWHKDLEFILITKGKMTYNVNGTFIDLSENSGIMVNSRQLHYGFSAERRECEFICILLSPELLQGSEWFYQNYVEKITENYACPYLYLDCNDWRKAVLLALHRIYHCVDTDFTEASFYFEVMEDFISIMKIVYENLHVEEQVMPKEALELSSLRNMITYIEEHLSEKITLESIASAGACCKSRSSLLFKKYLRDTPITYITKLRLRKSLAMLIESDASITEIAYEYGFCGPSYYCETFQKYYGMPPLKYRKNFKQADGGRKQ